jgi:hypothetical protein
MWVASLTRAVSTRDLPTDVRVVLSQVFTEAADALNGGDAATARSLVGTGRTVAETKVPPGERRAELLEGCRRVADVLDGEGNAADRQALAAAYCRRLARAVEDGSE